MPTLDDLNDVFADLERRAPEPLPFRPGVRHPAPVRRTRLAMVLSAAAVAAVAVGAVVVGHTGGYGRLAAPASQPTAKQTQAIDPAPSSAAATSSAPQSRTASGPSPVRITGIAGLKVVELDPQLRSGGLTVEGSDGVRWAFGWGNSALDPADKPDTRTATIDGQSYLVYPNRAGGGLFGVGVSAPGFGMTITAVGRNSGLSAYEPFLGHITFAAALGDRSSWFATAVTQK